MSDVTRRLDPRTHLNVSCPVGDTHAVKVQALAVIASQHAIAASIVEGLNDPGHSHESPRDPWPSTLTIDSALNAASRPLFDASGWERSSA